MVETELKSGKPVKKEKEENSETAAYMSVWKANGSSYLTVGDLQKDSVASEWYFIILLCCHTCTDMSEVSVFITKVIIISKWTSRAMTKGAAYSFNSIFV